jgi:uncharacterized protein
MPTVSVHYFDRPGPRNTEATLRSAKQRAGDLGLSQLVVASNTGRTVLTAAELMPEMQRIVAVTEAAGWWDTDTPPDPEVVAEAQAKGVSFVTGTHALMGAVSWAVHKSFGGLPPVELIARTYYAFSQGTKVAVECLLMAADAGLLDMTEDAIAIAGTGKGADTALVVKPTFSNEFFKLRIREFLAMPRG